jgi:cytochrome c oxidase assembly protein subunit 15
LYRFVVLTAVATFALILAGALATSNVAGDSVPTWPLAEQGRLLPAQWGGGVVYEYSHRIIASLVGLLSIVPAVWLWRADSRLWVRRAGLLALGSVVAQGLLGGMRVIFYMQPVVPAVAHAALAQAFFCLVVGLAVVGIPATISPSNAVRKAV